MVMVVGGGLPQRYGWTRSAGEVKTTSSVLGAWYRVLHKENRRKMKWRHRTHRQREAKSVSQATHYAHTVSTLDVVCYYQPFVGGLIVLTKPGQTSGRACKSPTFISQAQPSQSPKYSMFSSPSPAQNQARKPGSNFVFSVLTCKLGPNPWSSS